MGVYTNAQTNSPAFGTPKVTPYRKIEVTVSALVLAELTKLPIVSGCPTRATSLNVWSRTTVSDRPSPHN